MPIVALQMRDIERSASALGIEYRAFPMRTAEDLQRNLQLAVEWNAQAVVRLAGQGFALGPETGRLATERGLPSMLLQKRDVEAGGLMSYFADHRELGAGLPLTSIDSSRALPRANFRLNYRPGLSCSSI
jgi:putative tryptophan/tyrosine transport system substrate-binding protein